MSGRFSIEAIFKAHDRLTAVVGRVSGRIGRLTRDVTSGLRDVDRFNTKVLNGLGSIATKATAVGVVVGGIGAVGLKNIGEAGADFEEAITAVGAVSLMTRDQIADLEKQAIELGGTTKFTAKEVANAMELMGRAGFTNAETMAGVPGILAAAAAEGAEIAETASHVSNVLKGMGLAASESGRVADVLTLASARTNSSISSLGESMKNVASTARQFNIPLEDTVASVALLQDVGLDASEAGSAVNTMLTKMAAPSKDVAAKMAAMGVSFKDSKGNMLPFSDVLTQLSTALQKSGGNMDQVAFLADLVGLRGQKAAANLKDLFMSGKVGKLVEELKGAEGSAQKMADLRMQNLKGDIELLGGSIDSLKIGIFQTESGPLRDLVQGMTAWIDKNDELIKSGIVEFLKEGKTLVFLFASGVSDGLGAAGSALTAILGPLGVLDTEMNKLSFWQANIRGIGRAFAFLVAATGAFYAYALAVKAARVATFVFGVVTKAGRIAVLGFQLAIRGARAAMIFYQIASKAGVVSTLALSFASKAATIDMIAQRAAAFGAAGGFKAAAIGAGALGVAVGSLLIAWDQWNKLMKETEGFQGFLAGIGGMLAGEGFAKGVSDFQDEMARARAAAEAEAPAIVEIKPPDLGAFENTLAALSMPELGVAVPPPLEVAKPDPLAVKQPLPVLQVAVPSWLGSDTSSPAPGTPGNFFGGAPSPQVVPPSAAPPAGTTNTTNTNTTDRAEVTIKDKTGKAAVTKQPSGNTKLKVAKSGAF